MNFLIEELLKQGVDTFCIGPGSRSSPLTLAVAENPRCHSLVHFDERGLGFLALGLAKAKRKPIAVIVTSGTAVANLFPAVVEASLAQVPLILLTADRPFELRDVSANQTCDQVKFFGTYTRWYAELHCDDQNVSKNVFASTVSQAVYRAMRSPAGPVHLNCMLRENLEPSSLSSSSTQYVATHFSLSEEEKKFTAKRLHSVKKGVIVVGDLPLSSKEVVVELAKKLKWPLLTDPLSQLRGTLHTTSYFQLFLNELPPPEAVLHLGGRLVSKELLSYLSRFERWYDMVIEQPNRNDPQHLLSRHIEMDPLRFAEEILPYLEDQEETWLPLWKEKSENVENHLTSFFQERELNEPYPFYHLSHSIPSDWTLFLANSMPIRDANSLFFPKNEGICCVSNRGASGIDGNIATLIGFAEGSKRPLIAVLGDQTFLYDLNSLHLLAQTQVPIIFLVMNNFGGGIFSFLPISQKKGPFEKFWANTHSYEFEEIASFFNIPYLQPKNKEIFATLLDALILQPKTFLIEIQTNREENLALHLEMKKISEKKCFIPL